MSNRIHTATDHQHIQLSVKSNPILVHQSNGNSPNDSHAIDIDDLKKTISVDLLGSPLTGFRQFFYMLDPFKSEQFVRAPKLFDDINIFFAFVYFTGILLFSVYAFYNYLQMEPIVVNSMVNANSLPPISLNITTTCSGRHQCGNWTVNSQGKWIETEKVTLIQTWNHVPPSSPCYGINNSTAIANDATFIVNVCYSSNSNDGVYLNIPFTTGYTSDVYLNVVVQTNPLLYTNDMYSVIVMDPTQQKTLYMSQSKYVQLDESTTYEPCKYFPFESFVSFLIAITDSADFFYNGHFVDINTAILALKLQQFGYSFVSTQAMTVVGVLASIGGFASLFLTITTMCRGVTMMTYKSLFVLKHESSAGLCTNSFQLCLTTFCRCCGIGAFLDA